MSEGNFGNTYYHTHPSLTGWSWITWRTYYSVGSANIAMRVQGNSESYELYALLTDHLGGTVKTIRQDGLASELRYSAWGKTRESNHTGMDFSLRPVGSWPERSASPGRG